MLLGTLRRPRWLPLHESGIYDGLVTRLEIPGPSNTLVFDEEITTDRCLVRKNGGPLSPQSRDDTFSLSYQLEAGQLQNVSKGIRIFLSHLFDLYIVNELTIVGKEIRINDSEIDELGELEYEQVERLLKTFWDPSTQPVADHEVEESKLTSQLLLDTEGLSSDREMYIALSTQYPGLEQSHCAVVVLCDGDWHYDMYERLSLFWQSAILGLLQLSDVHGATLDEDGLWAHLESDDEFDLLALEGTVEDGFSDILQVLREAGQ